MGPAAMWLGSRLAIVIIRIQESRMLLLYCFIWVAMWQNERNRTAVPFVANYVHTL